MSNIEWTDRTWNPVVGCSRVSTGCKACYAEIMAARIANAARAKLRRGGALTATETAYCEVVRWERGGTAPADKNDKALPKWNGQVRLIRERLADPLAWRKPARIFVNSMSDLFHAGLSNEDIAAVFGVMAVCPRHTFQVLTKRPERAVEWFTDISQYGLPVEACFGSARYLVQGFKASNGWAEPWPLPNVWMGFSAENQETFDARWKWAVEWAAAGWLTWVSLEPLLGPVDMTRVVWVPANPPWAPGVAHNTLTGIVAGPNDLTGRLSWVVCGGESGPGARPMHPEWARSLRDQCKAAGVPFVFKQVGAWRQAGPGDVFTTANGEAGSHPAYLVSTDGDVACFRESAGPGAVPMIRVGKAAAGRLLDGVLHDEYPEAP